MKKLLLAFTVLCVIGLNAQCPWNTPEFPFETQYDLYSWSSGLYMPSQLGGAQTMTQISMRVDNVGSAGTYTYSDIHVYLRHSTSQDFSTDNNYPNPSNFIEVYSGGFTFNGTGVFTFPFNVANFAYNGNDNLEVFIENRGGDDHTYWYEPWFNRTNLANSGPFIGKVGSGSSFYWATQNSSLRRFNLSIQFNDVGDICSYPLPVDLLNTEISCNNNKALLNWSTATETNNNYFSLEYSDDGKAWLLLDTIKGAGNSTELLEYEVDLSIYKRFKLNYVRLSQTDYDGTTEILNTFSLNCKHSQESATAYPNPFKDQVQLAFSEPMINCTFYDVSGRTYKVLYNTSNGVTTFNTTDLKKGVYFLEVKYATHTEKIKLVKM